ncbi:MAG: hypothetical protein NZL93_00230 [Chthoniobacterales bacterium]|nr:hypothetical protein [Chthoniobacterales bacterium]
MRVEGDDWIIQPGDLARLESHEAFYLLANGERSESPVSLVLDFTIPEQDPLQEIDQGMDADFAKIEDIMEAQSQDSEFMLQDEDLNTDFLFE